MVGVERLWYFPTSSRTASRSWVMSRSMNVIPLSERWLFAQLQGGQPGWLKTMIFLAFISLLQKEGLSHRSYGLPSAYSITEVICAVFCTICDTEQYFDSESRTASSIAFLGTFPLTV